MTDIGGARTTPRTTMGPSRSCHAGRARRRPLHRHSPAALPVRHHAPTSDCRAFVVYMAAVALVLRAFQRKGTGAFHDFRRAVQVDFPEYLEDLLEKPGQAERYEAILACYIAEESYRTASRDPRSRGSPSTGDQYGLTARGRRLARVVRAVQTVSE